MQADIALRFPVAGLSASTGPEPLKSLARRQRRVLTPVNARLLLAVCEADAALGRATDWRALVERETGERLADAQGAILRAAGENLAGAFAILDRRQTS